MLPVSAEETGYPFARSILEARTEHLHKQAEGSAPAVPAVRYYISSLSVEDTTPERFAQLVRAHWNIENGSHWQRDKLWREDNHTMRQHRGAHILSTLRQAALSLHTTENAESRAGSTRRSCISHRTQHASHRLPSTIALILAVRRE